MMAFNHKSMLPDRKLRLLDDREGHWYETPDGRVLPSITTMLNGLDKRLWYYGWVQSIADKNGTTFGEAEGVAKGISESSMKVGTRMHKLAEFYLHNTGLDAIRKVYADEPGEFEHSPMELFEKIRPWLDAHVDNIHAVEGRMHSKRLGLAGTTDFIAEVDGVLSVGDFKNFRRKKYPSDIRKYLVQGTAYADMFEELTGTEIRQIVIICAVWGEKELQIFKGDPADYRAELYDRIAEFKNKVNIEENRT